VNSVGFWLASKKQLMHKIAEFRVIVDLKEFLAWLKVALGGTE
jgi:hypothetical protein